MQFFPNIIWIVWIITAIFQKCTIVCFKLEDSWIILILVLFMLFIGVMSPHKFHKATSNFKSCLAEDLSRYPAEFQSFLAEKDCIGNFYFSTIHISKYQQIWFILKLLLSPIHGQVLVGSVFSLNSNIIKANMKPETLIAKRLMIDHMVAKNVKPRTIDIIKLMLKALKSAYSSYNIHLEKNKNKFLLS